MKQALMSPLMLSLLLLLAGCGSDSVAGSGNIVTETRDVAGATGVTVAGSGTLILTQTNTEALTIEADDNLMEYVRSNV